MFVSLTAAFSGTVWEKLLEWYRGSVFRELIDYFDETYFSVDLGEYRHFSVTTQTGSVVKNLILGIALGLIVAAVISCYVKTVHGGFVRRLLREDCTSAESAKSLSALGYFHNIAIRNQLYRGNSFGSLVRSVDAVGEPAKTDRALSDARFYIPEELRYKAEVRYDAKGSGWLQLILTTILTIAAAVLICRFLPQLLGLADVILGIFEH